jgi:hypothetical protein
MRRGESTMLSYQNKLGNSFETFLFEMDDDLEDDDLEDDDLEDEYADLDDFDYDSFDSEFEEDFDYVNANGNGDADDFEDDEYIH